MQTALDFTAVEPESASQLIEDCYLWVCANRLLWQRAFVDRAFEDVDGRISTKRYIEDARASRVGITRRDGAPCKIKNAYSSVFARFLYVWHPDLRDAIPLASSKLDGCTIPRRPY